MIAFLVSLLVLFAGNTLTPPELRTLTPNTVFVNQPQFTLTVDGLRFTQKAEVRWDGTALQTTFVSTERVTAIVPASLVTTAGSHDVTVFVPGTTGGISDVLRFDVLNPVPNTLSITPTSAPVFSQLVTVTVNGSFFVPSSVVHFNGSAKSTTFFSATRLTAVLTAADLATVGNAAIRVVTPAPGGGTSQAQVFTVVHPTPTVTLLAPSFKTAGSSAFTITVDGTNFFGGTNSTVLWNNSARTTTSVSSTRVTASIPASDITTSGSANVAVRTTAGSSTRTSAPAVFSITAPATVNDPLTPVAPPPNLAPQILGPAGGSGGTAFTRNCGQGQIMSGVSYRAGLVLDAVMLRCRPVNANGTLGTSSTVGTQVGGGGPFTVGECGPTRAVNKVTVFFGSFVDGMVITCVPWDAATRQFNPDDPSLVVVTIGRAFFTTPRTFECNPTVRRQPARGIHGRAASVVDALGITCDEP